MGYIRKPVVSDLKNRWSLRDRVAAERAPEVKKMPNMLNMKMFRELHELVFSLLPGAVVLMILHVGVI